MQLFNRIHSRHWRGDLFGGVTAAIVSLPLALTFGIASGAGAEAGIYGAIIIGLFAALFGGTPTLISEPTGPMTVVMAAVLTSRIASDPEHGLAMAFTVVMIAGVFQIVLGVLNLGKYITLMPYSVISGFMSGIGCILIILQLAPLLGQAAPAGGVWGNITALPSLIANTHMLELGLGLATLLLLFLYPPRWAKRIPPQLIALVLGTCVVAWWLPDAGIRLIGTIDFGLPSIVFPTLTLETLTSMLVDGAVLGTLGCIDALLTAVIADSLTRDEHDSRKELIGQGLGNLFSGLLGGLPGAGATMGTVVNIQAGAKTALSGVSRALVLIVLVFVAADVTAYIPLAVLAAIAIKVGVNILDWSFIKRAHNVSMSATFLMYGVMLLTVFVDLIVAVGVGVFIANILTIERLSAVQSRQIQAISDTDDTVPLSKQERALLDSAEGKVLLMYFSGPLIFGVSRAIAREQERLGIYDTVLFDLTDVPLVDSTVSLAIENAINLALERNKNVFLICQSEETLTTFKRMGLFDLIGEQHVFTQRLPALRAAVQ